MNKVVDFFEKYAEWLALGVAGIFLLFMIWSYVVNPTAVKVQVGSEETTPGDVEPTVNQMTRALDAKLTAPGVPPIPVPNFSEQFKTSMGETRPRGPSTPEVAIGIDFRPGIPGAAPTINQPGPQGARLVQALPVTPAPKFVASYAGQFYILDPKFAANQAAAQGQPVAGFNPNLQNLQAQGQNLPGVDLSAQTIEFHLDMKALAEAWKQAYGKALDDARLPPAAAETMILRCEMQREEMLPNGKWGNPVDVPRLKLVDVPQWPTAGNKVQEHQYDAFARENQVEIAEPAFYQIMGGDLKEGWAPPSVVQAREAARKESPVLMAGQVFDPATWQGPTEGLTQQQKQQVYLYRQQQKKEQDRQRAQEARNRAQQAEAARNATRGGSGGSRGGRSRGMDYAPMPDGVIIAQAGPDRRSLIEEEMGLRGRRPGYVAPRDAAARPANPAMPYTDPNIQLQGGVPTTPFNPVLLVQQGLAPGQVAPVPGQAPATNIVCWAHDETAAPGKTYRYRMRVIFKNPIWMTNGLAANPAMEAQFALDPANVNGNQGWSDWSKEIRVAPTTRYFFATAKQVLQAAAVVNATVAIFKREKGEWNMVTFTVAPGDSIGQPNNGVDYTTGDTLVDLRNEVRRGDVRVITADQTGELRSSPLSAYQNDPEYKDLLQQFNAAREAMQGQGSPAGYTPTGTGTGTGGVDRRPVPPPPPPTRVLRGDGG